MVLQRAVSESSCNSRSWGSMRTLLINGFEFIYSKICNCISNCPLKCRYVRSIGLAYVITQSLVGSLPAINYCILQESLFYSNDCAIDFNLCNCESYLNNTRFFIQSGLFCFKNKSTVDTNWWIERSMNSITLINCFSSRKSFNISNWHKRHLT